MALRKLFLLISVFLVFYFVVNFVEAKFKLPNFRRSNAQRPDIPLRNLNGSPPSSPRISPSHSSSSSLSSVNLNGASSSANHQSAASNLNIGEQAPARRNFAHGLNLKKIAKNTAIGVAATGGVASIVQSFEKKGPSESDIKKYIDETIDIIFDKFEAEIATTTTTTIRPPPSTTQSEVYNPIQNSKMPIRTSRRPTEATTQPKKAYTPLTMPALDTWRRRMKTTTTETPVTGI